MIEENKRPKSGWLIWAVVGILTVAIIATCWIFLQGKETYISNDQNNIEVSSSFQCSASNLNDVFFKSTGERAATHVVKGIFNEKSLDKIFYSYEGTFDTESRAETASASLFGQYNKYMASKNSNPDTLSPAFSNLQNQVKITLFTSSSSLNSNNIMFFFLDMEDFQRIKSYSPEQFANLYKNKGFSCTVNN